MKSVSVKCFNGTTFL